MFLTYTRHNKLIGALLIHATMSMHASVVLPGNSTDQTQTFSQSIQEYAMSPYGQCFVAAHEKGAQNFALAVSEAFHPQFAPLAPQSVTLDSVTSTTNPLFDAQINHMTLMQGINPSSPAGEILTCIAAVTAENPSSIYFIDSIPRNPINILSIHALKDASNTDTTSQIIQLTTSHNHFIYAAVTGSKNDTFGEGNSGLAIVQINEIKKEGEKSSTSVLQQMASYKINNTTPYFFIGDSTITIQDNKILLNWNEHIDSLYIGSTIKTHSDSGKGGAQAILQGRWIHDKIKAEDGKEYIKSKFELRNIVPITAYAPGVNNIIGSIGTDLEISINQILFLNTSTALHYLVIFGGLGEKNQTKRTVYALPIVKRQDIFNGTLAKRTALPYDIYHNGYPEYFVSRDFVEPALHPGDLFTADDIEVQVGHGPIPEGEITSIFGYKDTVYAIVNKTDDHHVSGIFQSQAIFDNLGRIKEWTAWRRVQSNFIDQIYGAEINPLNGNITLLTGSHKNNVRTVKRTTWEEHTEGNTFPIIEWLNKIFNSSNGGIQGLYDFPIQASALEGVNLIIATGCNQIAIAQTGIKENGICKPLHSKELVRTPLHFINGTINQPLESSTNAIAISGGALNELQIVKAVSMACIGDRGYIFVGGTHGLAVLLNNNGCSFDAHIGLGNNLLGLSEGTFVKKIGSYSRIRKLICDDENGFLYIVTDSTFDRIDILASDFTKNSIIRTTLATLDGTLLNTHDIIFDAVVSRSLSLIATSRGLFHNNLLKDTRTVQSSLDIDWQHLNLPEGFNNVKQIFCITNTGREQDLTSGTGGNIYILDTQQGTNKAQIYRFTINTKNHTKDYPYSIAILPDFFIKNVPSYFVKLPGYRAWIHTDGSLFFHERDKNMPDKPILALLPSNIHSGLHFGGANQSLIPVDVQKTTLIQPIVRSSASGSWLLAQNNILSVNE